jgi:hypothetical protein
VVELGRSPRSTLSHRNVAEWHRHCSGTGAYPLRTPQAINCKSEANMSTKWIIVMGATGFLMSACGGVYDSDGLDENGSATDQVQLESALSKEGRESSRCEPVRLTMQDVDLLNWTIESGERATGQSAYSCSTFPYGWACEIGDWHYQCIHYDTGPVCDAVPAP